MGIIPPSGQAYYSNYSNFFHFLLFGFLSTLRRWNTLPECYLQAKTGGRHPAQRLPGLFSVLTSNVIIKCNYLNYSYIDLMTLFYETSYHHRCGKTTCFTYKTSCFGGFRPILAKVKQVVLLCKFPYRAVINLSRSQSYSGDLHHAVRHHMTFDDVYDV